MARLLPIVVLLAAACASVPKCLPPSFERIAALEDARSGATELAQFARDPDPAVRARAATALGRLWFPEEGAEVTRALLEALGDADANVRAAAAFALGVRGDPQAADKLLFVALDHHEADQDAVVRARALEAATKLERPELRERMLDGLLDPDPRVRLEAAEGASRWPTSNGNASVVNQRLVDSLATEQDRDVIVYTLFALERRKAKEALDVFLRFYLSPDADQRLFAVRGLAAAPHIDDAGWRSALIAATRDADERIVCEATLGLSSLATEEGSRALEATRVHPSAQVRICRWTTIGRWLDAADGGSVTPGCVTNMLASIEDASPSHETSASVRAAALERLEQAALWELSEREPLPGWNPPEDEHELPFAKRSPMERAAAVRARAALNAESLWEGVMGATEDPDLVVREAAIEALGTNKAPDKRVASILDGSPPFMPQAAADALERLRVPPRVRLKSLLADPDNGIRLSAVTALQEMPNASDLEPLRRCYETSTGDGANEIRFNVLRCAGKIGTEASLELFHAGILDGNPFVRRVAEEELKRAGFTHEDALFPDHRPGNVLDPGVVHPSTLEPGDLVRYASNPLVDVVTNRGTMRFELFPDEAPVHVASFLALAAQDHYDGTVWHRVVPDFVIQGGDYRGDGNGGGTWKGRDQSLRHEITPRKYVRGSLGMPRNEDVDSGGSQIFVTHRPTPHLDGRYTIFGELREGFGVLDAIEVGDRILDVKRVR